MWCALFVYCFATLYRVLCVLHLLMAGRCCGGGVEGICRCPWSTHTHTHTHTLTSAGFLPVPTVHAGECVGGKVGSKWVQFACFSPPSFPPSLPCLEKLLEYSQGNEGHIGPAMGGRLGRKGILH